MQAAVKNMTNYLVESETLPMFALPNVAIRNIIRYIQSLFKAEFLLQYLTCCDIARLATKRGSALFLHTLTNFCLTKCQTWTKVPVRRIVTLLHPYLNGKRFTAATSRKRSFPNLPNSTKLLSTANTGTHPSPAVCAPASPTSTRSIIRTWLSVGLSLPLWRGRRSPESTKSTSASRSKKNRKLVRKTK